MKKKIISLVAVAALVVTSIVGTTLAYFTDKEDTSNTFTMGKVDISLHEYDREGNKDEEYRKVLSTKKITPIAIRENSTAYDSKGFVDKMVTVENKSTIDAYARVLVAMPVIEGADKGFLNAENWLVRDVDNADNWEWKNEETDEVVRIDGKDYRILTATHKEKLAPKEETKPSMKGVYLNSKIDMEKTDSGYNYYMMDGEEKVNLGDISNFDILVCAQSVQARGFENAHEAFEKSGLPENPWKK